MIQTIEARELCSESEWELVESSFSPAVEVLLSSDLKSKLGRIRKLHQKARDLVDRQHSDARKLTTRRKTELFAEAIGRLVAAQGFLENSRHSLPHDEPANLPEEARALSVSAAQEHADRELESRKRHVLSAMAVRGEQQGGKSGSSRIQSHVGSATRRQQKRRDTKNH